MVDESNGNDRNQFTSDIDLPILHGPLTDEEIRLRDEDPSDVTSDKVANISGGQPSPKSLSPVPYCPQ